MKITTLKKVDTASIRFKISMKITGLKKKVDAASIRFKTSMKITNILKQTFILHK